MKRLTSRSCKIDKYGYCKDEERLPYNRIQTREESTFPNLDIEKAFKNK